MSVMNRLRRGEIGKFWLSPVGLAIVGVLPMFVSVIIPPDIYAGLVREPDLMFLNVRVIAFTLTCAGSFALGALLISRLGPVPKGSGPVERLYLPGEVVIVCLALTSLLSLASIGIIIAQSGNVIGRIMSGGGSAVKATLDTSGAFTEALSLQIAVIWWAFARIDQCSSARGLVKIAIAVSVLVALLNASVKLARYEIIPFAIGMFMILTRARLVGKGLRWWQIFAGTLVIPASLIFIFFIFASLRGQASVQEQLASLFGYGPASYNRLARMIEGDIRYSYAGHGFYTVGFLEHVPIFHNFINFQEMFGMPTREQAFLSEFAWVSETGLRRIFNWSTAFGYYYADLGYWAFAYLAAMGALAQLSFQGWWRGAPMNLALYPFIAGSVVLWGTFNVVVQPRLITYLGAGIVLYILERMTNSFGAAPASPGVSRVRV